MNFQDEPGISIITVCFNDRVGLEKTIQSVMAQEGVKIEHIVIDGGSTDGSLDVIRNHETHITAWSSEPDSGPYDGMNKGLELASGQWIQFMNSGDAFYKKDSLLSIKELLQREDLVAVYGDSIADYGNFQVFRKAPSFEEIWKGMVFSHQALLMKASQLGNSRFDNRYPKVADYELVLKCLAGSEGVEHAGITLAVCDAHGISTKGQAAITREYYRLSGRYFKLDMGKKAYFGMKMIQLGMVDIAGSLLPKGVYYKFVRKFRGDESSR